jgi:hypothetical protein
MAVPDVVDFKPQAIKLQTGKNKKNCSCCKNKLNLLLTLEFIRFLCFKFVVIYIVCTAQIFSVLVSVNALFCSVALSEVSSGMQKWNHKEQKHNKY